MTLLVCLVCLFDLLLGLFYDCYAAFASFELFAGVCVVFVCLSWVLVWVNAFCDLVVVDLLLRWLGVVVMVVWVVVYALHTFAECGLVLVVWWFGCLVYV